MLTKKISNLSPHDNEVDRSPGGKLALWVFWLFCLWFISFVIQCLWMIGQPEAATVIFFADPGASAIVEWLWAALRILTACIVGVILGTIAWYTRPPGQDA